ncbi:TetR/AcrR family transcriptional regulator [Eubacteriaceae bacterium ES3]|nr:TetR/AcrR family transcriptional regulator [Eubacteriaceae bacterium ES3]
MDNKEKILRAALQLFIKEGFHGTSTSKIANEAGISNGTLFHHFKTKEELISRLYLKCKEDYRNYLLDHMQNQTTSKAKIREFWFVCLNWGLSNQEVVSFFMMFANSPYIDKLSKEEATRNFRFVADLFQEAIDNETVVNIDPALMMNQMFAALLAFALYLKENPDKLDVYREQAFKMWWRSVVNI